MYRMKSDTAWCKSNLKTKELYRMQKRKGALLTIVLMAISVHHQYNPTPTLQLINVEVMLINNYH